MQVDEKFFDAGEMSALKIAQTARAKELASCNTTQASGLLCNAASYLIGYHPLNNPLMTRELLKIIGASYEHYHNQWLANFEYWRHGNEDNEYAIR